MFLSPRSILLGLSASLVACGSRSALPEVDESANAGTTSGTTVAAECDLHLDPQPLPAITPGGLCTSQSFGLTGPTMLSVRRGELDGLTFAGATQKHKFFQDTPAGSGESAHAVAARGEWVFAADVQSSEGQSGAVMIIAHRTGATKIERLLTAPLSDNFTELRITGNDAGLMVYSFHSYPEAHTLEAIGSGGDVFASAEGADPASDPDNRGRVAIRHTDTPEGRTSWLSLCTGELRDTVETSRKLRSPYVSWGRFLVFVSDDGGLSVEGSHSLTTYDLGEPEGAPPQGIFDFHPSGWALITTPDPLRFIAIHAGTGERHPIDIALPPGYSRYDNYTAAFGSPQFDANARELRVTSTGGVILPLRSASLGYLFASQNGSSWQPLGEPIGQVYTARVAEAGGTYLHIGNAFAVTLPAWDPAPPGVDRIDFQSTQLVRPVDGQSLLVDKSPMGSAYNDFYKLTADGGCLATSPVGGNSVVWDNAVTGESFSFPTLGQDYDSVLPSVDWVTDGEVDSASIL